MDVAILKVLTSEARAVILNTGGGKTYVYSISRPEHLLSIQRARFRALNIARERLERIIPNHSHGADSYEFHFNASGRGQLLVGGAMWALGPGSFYIVGPHVEHAQIPDPDDPQVDECVYLQLLPPERADLRPGGLAHTFAERDFWIGRGGEQMRSILASLFDD